MLEFDSVTKTYESFRLGPLDLRVENEILAILGPSGCGKTTLLAIAGGIVQQDAGTVSLHGDSLDSSVPEDRGTVVVFQDGALFPHMTVRENIRYAAVPATDVGGLADTFEVTDLLDQRASSLSGGERQRVAVARALAADPSALLLDEPLTNLDAPIRHRLRDDLRAKLAPLDIPVMYVTHDQSTATAIGDRLAILNDGKIQQIGTPATVFERPATPFVATFTGHDNVFEGSVIPGTAQPHVQWGPYQLETDCAGFEPPTDVWFSIRPEYVQVVPEAQRDETPNVLRGSITNRLFEGDTYRLRIAVDDIDERLELTVLRPAYDHHGLAERDRVSVSVPPTAIYLDEVE